MLSNASYIRSNSGPPTGQDATFPRFHWESVQNPVASEAAGRPIYFQQERVQIIQPGNPNQPVMLVTDEHRARWPKQYEAFQRGSEVPADGTPIEQWPVLNRNQVLEMKALQLHTVEQIAALNDLAIQRIGMGGRRLRELAMAYLDEAAQISVTSDALARAERAESQIAGLAKQVEEQRALLEQMHGELMRMKNAPSPIETYVPGQHDPLQPRAQPSDMASSLDNLPAPRRGRPPKVRDEAA